MLVITYVMIIITLVAFCVFFPHFKIDRRKLLFTLKNLKQKKFFRILSRKKSEEKIIKKKIEEVKNSTKKKPVKKRGLSIFIDWEESDLGFDAVYKKDLVWSSKKNSIIHDEKSKIKKIDSLLDESDCLDCSTDEKHNESESVSFSECSVDGMQERICRKRRTYAGKHQI